MNKEAQRIAIARVCGWTKILAYEDKIYGVAPKVYGIIREDIPFYLTDLNAIHEAEQTLTYEQHCVNTDILELVVGGPAYKPAIYAEADQRAEAFLKTLGLWKDQTDESATPSETAENSPKSVSASCATESHKENK